MTTTEYLKLQSHQYVIYLSDFIYHQVCCSCSNDTCDNCFIFDLSQNLSDFDKLYL